MSAPILLSAHHRAMHALYSEHHGWLQNWLRGKLGCAADAADLAQDTFLRILLKRELREIGMPRAFLRTIARGLVIDHWRREELQRAYLESIAHLPEAQAPSPEARELVLELLEESRRSAPPSSWPSAKTSATGRSPNAWGFPSVASSATWPRRCTTATCCATANERSRGRDAR